MALARLERNLAWSSPVAVPSVLVLESTCDLDWPYIYIYISINPVQVFRTLRDLHWEFLRLWTGFELPSSWRTPPAYGAHRNRNSFCVIDLGTQNLNGFQRPKSFQKNSWK